MHVHSASPSRSPLVFVILTLTWLLFFRLGVVGWRLELERQGRRASTAESSYRSLQLFHLHFHHVNPPQVEGAGGAATPPASHHGLPWQLETARFGAGLWALSLVPVLLGWFFNERLHRWWARCFWRGHTVVCGHCQRALSLIHDLRRKGEKVAFLGHCDSPQTELPRGVLHLPTEPNQAARLLGLAVVKRAAHLIALNDDDRANLELLFAADKCRAKPGLHCQVHLGDIHLYRGLNLAAVQPLTTSVTYQLFNYYQLVARQLACQHPLPETLVEIQVGDTPPPPEHYIIVGFGAFGQNVALELVKKGQQLVRRPDRQNQPDEWGVVKPRVTAIDPRGETAVAPLRRAHPGFFDHCDFQVEGYACESEKFLGLELLSAQDAAAKTSIIFCLQEEDLCLRTALLIRDLCADANKDVEAIYLRLARPERLGPLVDQLPNSKPKPRLEFFAPDSNIFSEDSILHQSQDLLAKEMHQAWLDVAEADARANNLPTATGKKWDELSEEDRNSNREAADHIWAKLRTLGYRLEQAPMDEAPPRVDEALVKELTNREEELARVEHYRWMTWRYLNGWRWGSKRDNVARLHPDMVSYEQLGDATKDKDRVNIRVIPRLLKAGRLRAVRGEVSNKPDGSNDR